MALTKEQLIEEISAMTALELSTMVKALEEKFGISAMPTMAVGAVAGPAEAAPAAAEKALFKVTIKDGGSDTIKVIKALRTFKKDMGLGDAKKAVVECQTIGEGIAKEEAEKMKKELEAAGAKIELTPM